MLSSKSLQFFNVSDKLQRRTSVLSHHLFSLLIVSVLSCSGLEQGLGPQDVLIPTSLAEKEKAFSGTRGPLVVVIGETHVNLEVQQRVSDLLAYLHTAYGMSLVCTEGTDTFDISTLKNLPCSTAMRIVADELLKQRNINAVEHFALTHRTARIVGVEDLVAYRKHQIELDSITKRAEQWNNDFASFLQEDMANVMVTPSEGKRFEEALKKYLETYDFEKLAPVLFDIIGRNSTKGKKLQKLLEEYQGIKRLSKIIDGTIPSTDDPYFVARDTALIKNTLRAVGSERILALVVGKAHLGGVEKLLEDQKVSYVAVLSKGIDDDLRKIRPEGMSEDEWIKILEKEEEVYEKWRKGTPLSDIEKFLRGIENKRTNIKPPPALGRPSSQQETILCHLVVLLEDYSRRQTSREETLQSIRPAYEKAGIPVMDFSPIKGGVQALVEIRGNPYWVILGPQGMSLPNDYTLHASREFQKNRQILLCSGGGQQPPRPPFPLTTFGNPWDRPEYRRIVELSSYNDYFVCYMEVEGEMWRVMRRDRRPLGITKSELKRKIEEFEREEDAAEKTLKAQDLCKILLVDIEEDLPSGASIIFQTSEDDLLGKNSLIKFVAYAGGHNLDHILHLASNPTISWSAIEGMEDVEEIANRLLQANPKIVGKKIAMWFDTNLLQAPGMEDAIKKLQEEGTKVNQPLERDDSLALFGEGSKKTWQVTLNDSSTVRTDNSREILSRASFIVSIGASVPQDLHLEKGAIMEMDGLPRDQVAEAATEISRILKTNVGERSPEEALRDWAKKRLGEQENLVELMNKVATLSARQNLTRTITSSYDGI